jgi:hypothetical protein
MDEMYRMLGREHEADLEREAVTRGQAAELRRARRAVPAASKLEGVRSRARAFLGGLRHPRRIWLARSRSTLT